MQIIEHLSTNKKPIYPPERYWLEEWEEILKRNLPSDDKAHLPRVDMNKLYRKTFYLSIFTSLYCFEPSPISAAWSIVSIPCWRFMRSMSGRLSLSSEGSMLNTMSTQA